MAFVLNSIYNLVKTGAYFTGFVITAGAIIAYGTKPENNSLQKQIETQSSDKSDGTVLNGIKKMAIRAAMGASTIDVKDFIVAKVANVTLINGEKHTFIGAFQHWFPLENKSSQN